METTRKTVLQEVLSRKKGACSLADAAALDGAHPAEILADFSFEEFNLLVARLQAEFASADEIPKEIER